MNAIDCGEHPNEQEGEGILQLLEDQDIGARLHFVIISANEQIALRFIPISTNSKERHRRDRTETCLRMFQATRAYMTPTKTMQT